MQIRVVIFIRNYLFALLATILTMFVVVLLPGLQPSALAILIMPLLIAATCEGQAYARTVKSRPTGRFAWHAALLMAGLSAGIAASVYMMFAMAFPAGLAQIGLGGLGYDSLTLAAVAGATVLVLRAGYAFGLATELKSQRILAR